MQINRLHNQGKTLFDFIIYLVIGLFRSSDGRGPLFWAYEFGHTEAIKMLEGLGADSKARDANGKTPIQLGIENSELNLQRSFPYATTLSGQTSQGYNSDHFDEDDDYDDEDDEF
jgi:hypothetical protein